MHPRPSRIQSLLFGPAVARVGLAFMAQAHTGYDSGTILEGPIAVSGDRVAGPCLLVSKPE